ncbi:uncharacterized protein LOC135808918 [Sycon ciliatum]|uniref:uncharacterized protein LOC135808918 n=1 Tax=Sycon ciliatum TaxID=27933 RepID=UPI0031F610A0
MGIVVGIAGEIAAEAAAEAAAVAAAEVAGAAVAEAAVKAAADAAEAAANAAAGAAVEGAAAIAAAEAAGEAAARGAIDAAIEGVVPAGSNAIFRQVIRSIAIVDFAKTLIKSVINVVESSQAGDRIKKLLKKLNQALQDAQNNMKTWNDQIAKAIKDGKLTETKKLDDGVEVNIGYLFSAEMNAKVAEFLSAIRGPLLKVGSVSKSTKNIGKIEDALQDTKDAFLTASDSFLAIVKKWDAQDNAIKKNAGINFQVAQLESNIQGIRDQPV